MPVSRSNGSGLQTGGGIPCRPNPAATLLFDIMPSSDYVIWFNFVFVCFSEEVLMNFCQIFQRGRSRDKEQLV